MRLLILTALLTTFVYGFGQIDFEPDSDKVALFPEVTRKIRNLPTDFDFQLRFWIHGGIALPDAKNLFIMTYKNGKWDSQSYKFCYKKRTQFNIVENSDSIWEYFKENEILSLPDMQALKEEFFTINENGDTGKICVIDGLGYTFEFIKYDKYKRINYHCPITYGETYTHIRELQFVSNIIRLIYRKIGNENEPC